MAAVVRGMRQTQVRRAAARVLALAVLATSATSCGNEDDTAPPSPPPPSPGYCEPTASGALTLTPLVSGLNAPVYVTAPIGDERMYIVERGGKIRVWDGGALAAAPFIDVSGDIATTDEEQGLLGLAFHPAFATNRRAFVFYTRSDRALVVAEYTASADGLTASSEGIILEAEHSGATNHNGGTVLFGPDGYLYVSFGEGPDNAQDPNTLLGKILRLDVDEQAPYGIPADNPWAGTNTGAEEMYAWGLRNPWRFGFDTATGALYIGDVGQGEFEEINAVTDGSGPNFGWPLLEGDTCRSPGSCDGDFAAPLYQYDRTSTSQCSVIGGSVYRGTCLTDLAGRYFFGDYCTGEINSFIPQGGQAEDLISHTTELDPARALQGRLVSFGNDGFGELYAVGIDGTIYRLERL